ncbi:SLC13 family permease, partial [Proteus mirabilis]|nr:SLC13 family permease [Proteus mirabilis]
LVREGLPSFQFFSINPIGIAGLVAGVLYMLVVRRWLGSSEGRKQKEVYRRTFRDLISDYQLAGRERRLAIRKGSPLI